MKRYLAFLLTALSVLTVCLSCVKDEAPIFDKSSSARMKEYLLNTRSTLVGAPNGWVMYYYPNGPGASRKATDIGGFVFTMTFTEEKVTIWSEMFLGGETSLYSMVADDGPVLNFDQFNEDFFYYATPAGSAANIYGLSGSSYYQAHKGDTNFNVMSVESDKIVLRGKRSGNYYTMYALPSGTTPKEFAQKSKATADDVFVSNFEGTFAGSSALFLVDIANRQIDLQLLSGEEVTEEVKSAFAYTPAGIKFYQPVTIGGVEFDEMTWDGQAKTLSYGGNVLTGRLPENWVAYEDIPGTYTLTYYATNADFTAKKASTIDITINEDVYRKSYLVSGIVNEHDVVMEYNLSSGSISLLAQVVGTETGYYYQLAAYACAAGYVNYTATIGLTGSHVLGSSPMTYTFGDNGVWKTYVVQGYILYKFSNAGTRIGRVDSGEWSLKTGNGYLRYVEKIVKKN